MRVYPQSQATDLIRKIFSGTLPSFVTFKSTMGYGTVRSPAAGNTGIDSRVSGPRPGEDASSPLISPREASPELTNDDGKPDSMWQRLQLFYQGNIGLFFVFIAQIFASIVCCSTPNCDGIFAGANGARWQ